MGTAGLNVKRLLGLLARKKIEGVVVDGDASYDHCVLRLTSVRRPAIVVFIEYINQGTEPRVVGLFYGDEKDLQNIDMGLVEWESTLKLEGNRKDDPEKIIDWIEKVFLLKGSTENRSRH